MVARCGDRLGRRPVMLVVTGLRHRGVTDATEVVTLVAGDVFSQRVFDVVAFDLQTPTT